MVTSNFVNKDMAYTVQSRCKETPCKSRTLCGSVKDSSVKSRRMALLANTFFVIEMPSMRATGQAKSRPN